MQATSAYLFGFHGWSLLLPQALAGVLCVALLYHLAQRILAAHGGDRDHLRTLDLAALSVCQRPTSGSVQMWAVVVGALSATSRNPRSSGRSSKTPGVEAHPRTQVAGWRS